MEEPPAGVVGSEPENNVAVVRDSDRVLESGFAEVTMQQTSSVQVEGVFQIDLLDVGIWRSTHTDHVESVSVQVERVTQVRLLDLIDEYHFNDCV